MTELFNQIKSTNTSSLLRLWGVRSSSDNTKIPDLSGNSGDLTITGTNTIGYGPNGQSAGSTRFYADGYAVTDTPITWSSTPVFTMLFVVKAGAQPNKIIGGFGGHSGQSAGAQIAICTQVPSAAPPQTTQIRPLAPGIGGVEDFCGSAIDGDWHVIAMTCDGTTVRVYQDDTLVLTKALAWGDSTPPTKFYLGGCWYDGQVTQLSTCLIAYTAIWSSCLTGAQISAIAGKMPSDPTIQSKSVWLSQKIGAFYHFGLATFLTSSQQSSGDVGTWDANLFDPTDADIDQWLDVAASYGAQYAVITTLHYAGFKLWPSRYSYGVTDTNWYAITKRDLVAEFVDGCRARNMQVGLYMHVRDPHWEEQNPGWTYEQNKIRVKNLLEELLTNYGPIDLIWFDGWSYEIGYINLPWAEITSFIRTLQPGIVIIENNHVYDQFKTDYASREDLVDGNPESGYTVAGEYLDTLGGMWMWHSDLPAVSVSEADGLWTRYQACQSGSSNFVINFNPDYSGQVPADQVAVITKLKTDHSGVFYLNKAILTPAEQLAADQGAVEAGKADMNNTRTILGVTGTQNLTALTTAAATTQFNTDKAAVTAVKSKIDSTVTLLEVQGAGTILPVPSSGRTVIALAYADDGFGTLKPSKEIVVKLVKPPTDDGFVYDYSERTITADEDGAFSFDVLKGASYITRSNGREKRQVIPADAVSPYLLVEV